LSIAGTVGRQRLLGLQYADIKRLSEDQAEDYSGKNDVKLLLE
jgi:hypothetical protein